MAKRVRKPLISIKSWRKLYDLAVKIYDLAPWEWITESEFFGVQNPKTGEIGFISVMGMSGEHYAIAAYLGPEGLYGYWDVSEAGPFGNPEAILEVPQFQLSFEDKSFLTKKDRDLVSQSGHRFRGQNGWPMFRSYKPGFYPWYLEPDEVDFLTHILEQSLDVLSRYLEDETVLDPVNDETYLVRVPQQTDSGIEWRDELIEVLPPEDEEVEVVIEKQIVKAFTNLEKTIPAIDVDFFMLPSQIQEKSNERPYFGRMLLIVDSNKGMVLASELLAPKPSLEDMWANVPEKLIQSLVKINTHPQEIRTPSPHLHAILEPIAKDLGFSLTLGDYLTALEDARGFLLDRFM